MSPGQEVVTPLVRRAGSVGFLPCQSSSFLSRGDVEGYHLVVCVIFLLGGNHLPSLEKGLEAEDIWAAGGGEEILRLGGGVDGENIRKTGGRCAAKTLEEGLQLHACKGAVVQVLGMSFASHY